MEGKIIKKKEKVENTKYKKAHSRIHLKTKQETRGV
jgi:hypothetical protein